ncbi:MAG: energy transducer TonB [Spirosomaceae bacterium]|nr:energy transducer TonB [Spirosomataceae bacterium]
MVYPEAAKEKKIEGKVFLTFVVRKDGTLADIQILKGLGYGCDAESVKLLAKSGTWKPAMHKGKVVNCRFNVPIPFELNPK